jgi:hypothetical protein
LIGGGIDEINFENILVTENIVSVPLKFLDISRYMSMYVHPKITGSIFKRVNGVTGQL